MKWGWIERRGKGVREGRGVGVSVQLYSIHPRSTRSSPFPLCSHPRTTLFNFPSPYPDRPLSVSGVRYRGSVRAPSSPWRAGGGGLFDLLSPLPFFWWIDVFHCCSGRGLEGLGRWLWITYQHYFLPGIIEIQSEKNLLKLYLINFYIARRTVEWRANRTSSGEKVFVNWKKFHEKIGFVEDWIIDFEIYWCFLGKQIYWDRSFFWFVVVLPGNDLLELSLFRNCRLRSDDRVLNSQRIKITKKKKNDLTKKWNTQRYSTYWPSAPSVFRLSQFAQKKTVFI